MIRGARPNSALDRHQLHFPNASVYPPHLLSFQRGFHNSPEILLLRFQSSSIALSTHHKQALIDSKEC